MELPRRPRGDELLKSGELAGLRGRLRAAARRHDLRTVIACAFDHRTRMLPFVAADMLMAPAGVRAIGSAMVDAGFPKTRIVLQQWNPDFRPARMLLDGAVPDLFMVSSMQIHSARCRELIRDAWRIDPARRPLIVAGGPKVIYEPWDVFGTDPADPWGADVAVTGEEHVLLSLLEAVLSHRAGGEPMRRAFARARDGGALDGIPGLVYARGGADGAAEQLVDTGIQRLLGDLDELPDPVLGYGLLEPPSRGETLSPRPLPPERVRRHTPIACLVLTLGCRFGCPYCPIPAYNQRQFRSKSGQRIALDFDRLQRVYGIRHFFGADDNFFNDKARAVDIAEALLRRRTDGASLPGRLRWGTEVTVQDTLGMKDHLRLMRKAGIMALWLGVEDMSGALVRKGQTADRTIEAFALLKREGIEPMPMLMHHDDQPLYTPGRAEGLLNQVHLVRKAGAPSLQVLMITPAPGSRLYESTYESALAFQSAAGRPVEPHMVDGNYVVASGHPQPWRKQLNLLAAYLYFYNPLRLLIALVRPVSRLYLVDAGMQAIGMWGLAKTVRRTLGWAVRLMRGRVVRRTAAPVSRIPMRSPDGGPASHLPAAGLPRVQSRGTAEALPPVVPARRDG